MKFKIEIDKKEERDVYKYTLNAPEISGSFEEMVQAFELLFTACPKIIPCATLAILNIDENEVCDEDLR